MTRLLKKSKWVAAILVAMMLLTIMPVSAFAEKGNGATTDIDVVKVWEDNDNVAGARPESITVQLKNGDQVVAEIDINGDESAETWEGTFESVPVYDEQGNPIQYTVVEEPVAEYDVTYVQPVVGGMQSIVDKVPNCNEDVYSIGDANIVIAKAANDDNSDGKTSYYIWAKDASDIEETTLLDNLNNGRPKLEGAGEAFSIENTVFRYGEPGIFDILLKGATTPSSITIENGTITFEKTKLWAMFWHGTTKSVESAPAVIKNTYNPTIPEPDSTGNLLITKKVTGLENAKGTQKFNFVLSGEALNGKLGDIVVKDAVTGEDKTKDTLKNELEGSILIPVTVDLSQGEASTKVEGLPQGNYIIKEVLGEKNSAVAINGYDFKGVALTTDKTVDIADKQATFTVGEKVSFDVAFENQYTANGNSPQPITGNLLITKKVTGLDDAIGTQKFNFVLSSEALKNYEGAVTVDEEPVTIDTENGEIKLPVTVVKDSGNVKVEGLPVGDYTLVEDKDGAAIKDYTLDVSLETEKTQDVTCVDDKATFTVDDSNVSFNVTFTNTYTKSGDGEDNGNTGGGNTGNENTGGNTGNENTGGNTGNENTGGNTGNEGSNNDTDNTTTIVDEPTPLVNVPEEPMEEPIEEIEIDEPEVPLTEAPGEPVAIEEPEVPLGDAPKTGDSSNAVLFVALMLAAGAGLVVTRRKFN